MPQIARFLTLFQRLQGRARELRMTSFVFAPPIQPSVGINGAQQRFPVRRILCVGRNYAAHRQEMGGDDRNPPFFFAKPADALADGGQPVAYPSATYDLHHEIELVIAIGKAGVNVPAASALDLVFGYAVGVDLTRRDLQAAAKAKGEPWEAAKGFDQSAPIGEISPWKGAPPAGRIWLSVNGQIRQDSLVDQMIWTVPEIIAQASMLWGLAPGDLIFTGTPDGVGPIQTGDRLEGGIDGLGVVTFSVVGNGQS